MAWGGATALVVCVAIACGVVLLANRSISAGQSVGSGDVALIFTTKAADGATQASLIALVRGAEMRDISPDTSVTIAGSTYSRLGDAYAFGGGRAVLAALPGVGPGVGLAYVAIPEVAWHQGAARIPGGVRVTLPHAISAFGPAGLISLKSGDQTLSADAVDGLVEGADYGSLAEATHVRRQIEIALVRALGMGLIDQSAVGTDLSGAALHAWIGRTLPLVKPE